MQIKVGIILGSESDEGIFNSSKMVEILDKHEQSWELSAISAHRNSEEHRKYCESALQRGVRLFIAVAGMSAALPGDTAKYTKFSVPVIGVALSSKDDPEAKGALSAMMLMPKNCPLIVANGTNERGLVHAALLAVQILTTGDDLACGRIRKNLTGYIQTNTKPAKSTYRTSEKKEG